MLNDLRVIIVGLGLMGGSLARALRPYVKTIVAVDANQTTCAEAVQSGVVDHAMTRLEDLTITHEDWLILAVPVGAITHIVEGLPRLAPDGCLLMDLGSTKQDICRKMSDLPGWFQAIGGHPMCGKETSGFGASSADLYHNATFLLTPTVRTTPHLHDLALALIDCLGSHPLIVPPERHDQLTALVSHMPYLLSAMLMQQASAEANHDLSVWQVSASGFRDTSRLSGSSPRMLSDILQSNRHAVLEQLRRYQQHLNYVIGLVDEANCEDGVDALNQWLQSNQAHYQRYRHYKVW